MTKGNLMLLGLVALVILLSAPTAWDFADTKISALTAASAAADANEYAINEAGTSKKVSGSQIKTYVTTAPVFAAGTASANTWPKLTSGTLLTTAEAGALEYDGKSLYGTPNGSNRGVLNSTQFITLRSAYNLTSQTALQKAFNAPTNGAITVPANVTLFFEYYISLSSLSTSNGTFSLGFLGTATVTRIKYWTIATKAVVTPTAPLFSVTTTTASTATTSNTTTATGQATAVGTMVIGAGGTIIPAVGMSQASAAVVGVESSFRMQIVGSDTVQSVGNWN